MSLVRAIILSVAALLLVASVIFASVREREQNIPPEILGAAPDSEYPYHHESEVLLPSDDVPLDGLSGKMIGWGIGPDRDELGRPTDAVSSTEKYRGLNAVFIMPDERNTVYLTFDLGYENGYTEKILDAMKERNVKGVFFITTDYLIEAPEIVERIIKEGHTLGNHTVHHPSMPSISDDEAVSEISGLHDEITERYGYDMTLFRFPRGEFSQRSLALVKSLGYSSVFWSFAYKDWLTDDQPEPAASLQRLTDSLHPGAIYLLHAVSSTNAEILGDFIDAAKEQGYEFRSFLPSEETSVGGILEDGAVIG